MQKQIVEAILTDKKGNKIILRGSELEKFFFISTIDFRRFFILSIFKKPKYFPEIVSLFFEGLYRKLATKKPAIKEESIFKKIKKSDFQKIDLAEFKLSDSQEIKFDVSNIHISNLLGDLVGIVERNQYNISPEIVRNKNILDLGAHHGVFSIYCAVLGAKKIYSFEPMSGTFKTFQKNTEINGMKNIIFPINEAVGDKISYEKIFFSKFADGSASLNKKFSDYEKVRVTKLDSFIKNNKIKKVDLIKMDIEGNEEKALIGATKTIKKDKPILTFSAYHKPTDKKILPETVKKIREDYKIKLFNSFEEDFYCY